MSRLAVLVLLLGATTPAAAYVRSPTRLGCHPVHWADPTIALVLDGTSLTDMTHASVEQSARVAVAAWQDRTRRTSAMTMTLAVATTPRETTNDGVDVITFRTSTWCRPSGDPNAPPICYDPNAQAITTITYVSAPDDPVNDGRILDADIELNAVVNHFYDADAVAVSTAGARHPLDLWNTLAHELGHVQGLDHPCRLSLSDGLPACVRDHLGGTVPMCATVEAGRTTDSALQAIFDATMYPSAAPQETKKRTAGPDDVAGVVESYPVAPLPVAALPDLLPVPTATPPDLGTVPSGPSLTQPTPLPSAEPAVASGCVSAGALPSEWSSGVLMLIALVWRRRRA